jgi:matrixin
VGFTGRAFLGASGIAMIIQVIGCGTGPNPASLAPVPASAPEAFPLIVTLRSGVTGGSPIQRGTISIGTDTLPISPGDIVFGSVSTGDHVLVAADGGYMPRQTLLRTADAALTVKLWPLINGLGVTFVRQIIYDELEHESFRLLRPRAAVYVRPDPAISGDRKAMSALGAAAALLNAVGSIPFVVTTSPPAGALLATVGIQPGKVPDGNAASTSWTFDSDYYMTGAEVSFRDVAAARAAPLVAHELGHVRGLCHVDDPDALMNHIVRATAFLPKEIVCIRMADIRLAGQVAPDDDSAVIASAERGGAPREGEGGVRTRTFVGCNLALPGGL